MFLSQWNESNDVLLRLLYHSTKAFCSKQTQLQRSKKFFFHRIHLLVRHQQRNKVGAIRKTLARYSKIGCRRTYILRGQARRSYLQAAFLGQTGTFLSFKARRFSAMRSSTSDLTVGQKHGVEWDYECQIRSRARNCPTNERKRVRTVFAWFAPEFGPLKFKTVHYQIKAALEQKPHQKSWKTAQKPPLLYTMVYNTSKDQVVIRLLKRVRGLYVNNPLAFVSSRA